jgi:hypothetical protein
MDYAEKDRDEDLTLLDKILFPLGIVAGMLGMGTGLMVIFQVL